mmetsp:Transcript_48919/g.57146  ORF Transcript_48919/g.57146 Transcript_48919/m.57146 type:complete len:410 (-) Transcript_48919:149-1378(-)
MQSGSDVAAAGIIQPAPDMVAAVIVLPAASIETDQEPVYCHLKSKCKNGLQKPYDCLHCNHLVHVSCAAIIRPIYHTKAKKEKEKELVFDDNDIICSKACYNKMVKGKLLKAAKDSVPSGAKVTRFWHNDGPNDSINSLSVLMNWLTTEGNYSRWRGGDKFSGVTKKTLATSIVNMIHDQVGVQRNQKHVINKITTIESGYRAASDWLGATGAGVECQISVKEYVMKLCPFFYDLQDVMEDRASTKPLFSSGCELEQEDDVIDNAMESLVESLEASEEYDDKNDDYDDNDEGDENGDSSTIQSTPSAKKGSARKRIKGVVLPRSNTQFKGEHDETSMMINLKRKQLNDEAESRKESFRYRLKAAQVEKVQAEAKTARIIAKVTLMRERKKLIKEGFTQEEVDEALPLDM